LVRAGGLVAGCWRVQVVPFQVQVPLRSPSRLLQHPSNITTVPVAAS
jgi:hypothetical protein